MTAKQQEQMPELKCPFERGQVWMNPDDEIMMIISVRNEGDGYKVDYISQDAERGSFWDTNKYIIENISLVEPRPAKAVQGDIDRAVIVEAVGKILRGCNETDWASRRFAMAEWVADSIIKTLGDKINVK